MKKISLVIGNGPETKLLDFQKASEDYATIGMNAAYRDWDRIGFRPDHYISMDMMVTVSHADEIVQLIREANISSFLLHADILKLYPELEGRKEVKFWHYVKKKPDYLSEKVWEEICSLRENSFFSLPHVTTGSAAIRYALFLGYEEVKYIGLEASYTGFLPKHRLEPDGSLYITETPAKNPNYYFDDYQREGDIFLSPNPDHQEICNCEYCKGGYFDSKKLHRLALEYTINSYEKQVSKYLAKLYIPDSQSHPSVSLYILNFNNINHSIEQAKKMERQGISTKIISASREKIDQTYEKIIYVDGDNFYGSMAEIAIEDSTTEITGLMACDVTIEQEDVINTNLQWAFLDPGIAIYAPNVDYTFWNFDKRRLQNYGRDCFFVLHTDSSLWFTRTKLLKSLLPFDIPRPFYGWGIEVVASQIALSHNLRAVRDYAVTVKHPHTTSYNKKEAEEQQMNLYERFGGCTKVDQEARKLLLRVMPSEQKKNSDEELAKSKSRMAIISCSLPFDNSKRRNRNSQVFLSRLHHQGLSEHVFFVNAIITDKEPKPVPIRKEECCTFIDVEMKEGSQYIWQREALINIALNNLPEQYDLVTWLDLDILFDSDQWYQNTIDKLKEFDVVQPWSLCQWYGLDGKIFKESNSVLSSDLPFNGRAGNHPGLAYAAKLQVLKDMGALFAVDITGANEIIMLGTWMGIKDTVIQTIYGNASDGLIARANKWGYKVSTGYVNNSIKHLYNDHISELNNKGYKKRPLRKDSFNKRIDMFREHRFNPDQDLKLSLSGLIEWDTDKKGLIEELKRFLVSRYEDEF